MTGGTALAQSINRNLAIICGEFGFGMGLGSCRQLLYDDSRIADFNVKNLMPDQPLLANLGIAQIEELLLHKELDKIEDLLHILSADGLIIHVNPLQEWLQPEGDTLKQSPLATITDFLKEVDYPVIVKEVGQGMGKASLDALLKLPLEAVDFAALGGTNFSKLELFRSEEMEQEVMMQVSGLGHDANTMVQWTNEINHENKSIRCKKLIISGGVKSFLDGYYLIEKSQIPAVYGMASGFLKYALEGIDPLRKFAEKQVAGLKMTKSLLRINTSHA